MQFHVLKFVLNCITGTDENYASMLPISRWDTTSTLFSVCSVRDDDVTDNKQSDMKNEPYKLYPGVFRIFLPNAIKNDPHNFELYSFKFARFRDLGIVFERAKREWTRTTV